MVNHFCIITTTLLLIYIIQCDIRHRIIPNTASVLLLVNTTLYCGVNGYWLQLLVVVPVFIVSLLLWRFGLWGAGDVKLLVSTLPMVSLNHVMSTLFLIVLLGGALSVGLWVRAHIKKIKLIKHVPYGVPISIGCWLGIIASIP